MKICWYCIIVLLCVLSCDDSEKGITITDYKGLSVELFWKGVEPKNCDGIGLTTYGPDGSLFYQNFDSLTFSYTHPDGKYKVQVEQFSKVEHQEYVISVKGLESNFGHTFENSLGATDNVGAVKTLLFITTDRYNYTLESP